MLKKKQWKNTVLRTWLVSYICILLIPVFFNFAIYQRTITLIREEINVANSALLSEIRRGMDNILRTMEMIGTDIMVNGEVQALAEKTMPFTDQDYYQALQLRGSLKQMHLSKNDISTFYVYFKRSDYVVAADMNTDSRRFYTALHESNSMSYEEWRAILDQDFHGQYVPMPVKRQKNNVQETVAYINTILQGTEEEAVIVILVDTSTLEQQLRTIGDLSQGTFYIVDNLDRTIYSNDEQREKFTFSYKDFTEMKGVSYTELEKEPVVVEYETSEYANWKYIYVTPENIFLQKVQYIKQFIVIDLLLCLALGGVIIFLFAKKNYMPLELLMQKFKTEYGYEKESGENEYQFIEKMAAVTKKEQQDITDQLKAQNNVIRQSILAELLHGKIDTSVQSAEQWARDYQISFISDQFVVMIFYIEDVEELFPEEQDLAPAQRYQLMQFIVTNIAEEVMQEVGSGVVCEVDHVMAGIVSLRSNPQPALRAVAEKIQDSILEYFQMEMTVAISGIHVGLGQVHIGFEEAIQALQYRMLLGSQEVIFYQDIQASRGGQYEYPLETEQALVTQIKAGNYEAVDKVIDQVYEKNFQSRHLSVDMAKCLLFDLVGTVMKTIPQTGEMSYISRVAELSAEIGRESAHLVVQHLKQVLAQLCEAVNNKAQPRENDLREKAEAYIAQHYTDEALGVASIAQLFGMTPSYVSKLFRDAAGMSLPDYILRVRMEQAKKLIEEDRMQRQTFQEIAQRVGFSNVRTFSRQFKKYTGVTPGTYREAMAKGKTK